MNRPGRPRNRSAFAREVFRSGTLAGLAMIPFAAVFRFYGLRINEYGRRTLELVVGQVPPRLHNLLTLVEHLIISWLVAVPLLLLLERITARRMRVLVGALYGAVFYLGVNALALPWVFGDPPPWTFGFSTVYPSLVVHLVYGIVVAVTARPAVRVIAVPTR